jgi:hypothetical protein
MSENIANQLRIELQQKDGELRRVIAEKAKIQNQLDAMERANKRQCEVVQLAERREQLAHQYMALVSPLLRDVQQVLEARKPKDRKTKEDLGALLHRIYALTTTEDSAAE